MHTEAHQARMRHGIDESANQISLGAHDLVVVSADRIDFVLRHFRTEKAGDLVPNANVFDCEHFQGALRHALPVTDVAAPVT